MQGDSLKLGNPLTVLQRHIIIMQKRGRKELMQISFKHYTLMIQCSVVGEAANILKSAFHSGMKLLYVFRIEQITKCADVLRKPGSPCDRQDVQGDTARKTF